MLLLALHTRVISDSASAKRRSEGVKARADGDSRRCDLLPTQKVATLDRFGFSFHLCGHAKQRISTGQLNVFFFFTFLPCDFAFHFSETLDRHEALGSNPQNSRVDAPRLAICQVFIFGMSDCEWLSYQQSDAHRDIHEKNTPRVACHRPFRWKRETKAPVMKRNRRQRAW